MTARLVMNDRPVTLRQTDRLRDAAEIDPDPPLPQRARGRRQRAATWAWSAPTACWHAPAQGRDDGARGSSDLPFVKDTLEDLRERWHEAQPRR